MNDDINNGRPIKKILIGLAVAMLLLFVVALWNGWIGLSVDSNEDIVRNGERQDEHEMVDLTLSLDRTEVRQDAHEVGQELAGLGDKAKVLAEMENSEGRLQRLDQDSAMLTVALDDKKESLVLRVNNATEFELEGGEKGQLDDLRVGDHLRVVYQTKDKVHWAHEITVTTPPKEDDAS